MNVKRSRKMRVRKIKLRNEWIRKGDGVGVIVDRRREERHGRGE